MKPIAIVIASILAGAIFLGHNVGAALMADHDVHFIGFDDAGQLHRLFLTTIPSRSCVVMVCTSPAARSNSAAICSLDRFRRIKYRHSTQARKDWGKTKKACTQAGLQLGE